MTPPTCQGQEVIVINYRADTHTTEQLLNDMRSLAKDEAFIDCGDKIEVLLQEAQRRDVDRLSIQGLCYNALRADGVHHKQWFLEQILQLVLRAEGYERIKSEWRAGIAP